MKNKKQQHLPIAFRALLEQIDMLLRSAEISPKAKAMFAENVENSFMQYGLLEIDKVADKGKVPQ